MTKVSLRYARALLLAADKDAKKLDELAANLDAAAEALSEKNSLEFFSNPNVSDNDKETLIQKTFAKHALLNNLLKLVALNGKMPELKNIAASFRDVLSEAAGVATARIESATKLDKNQIADLTKSLKKFTGKEVSIETSENPKLLGGVRVYLGDEMIDLSLASRIQGLSRALS